MAPMAIADAGPPPHASGGITTIVAPSALNCWNSSRTAAPAVLSMLPAGSLAKTMAGRPAVVHVCRVARRGALDALPGSVPGRPGLSPEAAELAAAREETGRLRATVTGQAVALHLHQGLPVTGQGLLRRDGLLQPQLPRGQRHCCRGPAGRGAGRQPVQVGLPLLAGGRLGHLPLVLQVLQAGQHPPSPRPRIGPRRHIRAQQQVGARVDSTPRR
jgi:hypothetical protein